MHARRGGKDSDDTAGANVSEVAALIAAAGEGQRLGLGPKLFVTIAGSTLLEHCVSAYLPLVDEVVVAVPVSALERARALVPEATVIVGAASRQETVTELLRATSSPVVLVHDVARPFVTAEVVSRVLAAVRADGAASAALPVADTIIDTLSADTLPRERLRAVQTPQGFQRELLVEAHRVAGRDGVEASDDAALVRRLGHPVTLVEGSRLLFKLTSRTDLPLLEALFVLWSKQRNAAA